MMRAVTVQLAELLLRAKQNGCRLRTAAAAIPSAGSLPDFAGGTAAAERRRQQDILLK